MQVQVLYEGSRPREIGYHFTNYEGLKAIVQSNTMLSTNEPIEKKSIARFAITFPDGSVLNIENRDKRYLESYLEISDSSSFYDVLPKLSNKLLKQKLQEFPYEELKKIKIEEHEYTPYKELIGKKTWSYTRPPKGMHYRNLNTFGENTVRIGIDIDKLTEKGYKVIPFSWMRLSKDDPNFEYEERIIGKKKKSKTGTVEGTFNFADFITEIAIYTNRNIYSYNFRYSDLFKWATEFENIKTTVNNPEISIDTLKDIKNNLNSAWYGQDNRTRFIPDEIPRSVYEMFSDTKFDKYMEKYREVTAYKPILDKLMKLNPNIKIVYINSKNKKPKKTSDKTIAKFINCLINNKKTKVGISKEDLENPQFEELLAKVQELKSNFTKNIKELLNKIETKLTKQQEDKFNEVITQIKHTADQLNIETNDLYLVNLDYDFFYAVVASSKEEAKANARKLSQFKEDNAVKILNFSDINKVLSQIKDNHREIRNNWKQYFKTKKEFIEASDRYDKGVTQLYWLQKLVELYGFDIFKSDIKTLPGSDFVKSLKNQCELITKVFKWNTLTIPMIAKNHKRKLYIKRDTITKDLTFSITND